MELKDKEKIEIVLKQDKDIEKGMEIDLREIIEFILKGKKLIVLFVIAGILLSSMGYIFTRPAKGSVSMIISFNFDGIEKGLDPYGKNFDISKIKSPAVLKEVVGNLELSKYKITEDDIRTNMSLTPVIPGDITQKIKSLEEAKQQGIQDVQEFTYYPNRYLITLGIPKSFKISNETARSILDEVFKQYQEYFFYSYSDRSVLSNALGPISYEGYDYPEISDVISNQINIIQNYLMAKNKEMEASNFRSKKTGLAFVDIIDSIDVLRKVDLQRIDSIIGSYNLTKDKDKLIKLYEYRIQQSQLESEKKTDESKIYEDMLNKYQKDKSVLLVSGLGDQSNTLESDQTSKYYDEMMDKSAVAGVSAKNALHDAAYYQTQIEKLKSDTVEISQKEAAEKQVLDLLPDINKKLLNWITLTNDTVQEYYESQLYNSAITKLSPAEYKGNLSGSGIKLYVLIGIAAGLVIGMIIVLSREYWRKGKTVLEQ